MSTVPNRRTALPEWLSPAVKLGLIGGVIAVLAGLEGLYVEFNTRFILARLLTMGQLLPLIAISMASYFAIRRSGAARRIYVFAEAAVVGLVVSVMLVALVLLGSTVNIGAMFLNAVPDLYNLLTFHQDLVTGSLLSLGIGIVVGLLTAGLYLLPAKERRAILYCLGVVVIVALFQDLITTTLSNFNSLVPLLKSVYASNGLSYQGAIALIVVVAVLYYFGPIVRTRLRAQVNKLPPAQRAPVQMLPAFLGFLILLALPSFIGIYLSQVLDTVGLYIMLGLGLNIVVGLAGLLDLGYVAFFAIGAYTVGVMTSTNFDRSPIVTSWWEAIPFAVLVALAAGILLGIPVLKVRGDYLAIVTLGFGEIIRLLALSDFLKPFIGGAQGVLEIAKPVVIWVTSLSPQFSVGPVSLVQPQQFYYIILLGCLFIALISSRLKASRLGRAWMAMREDEDVAQAMGVDLVSTKLLAFGMGASFGGLSGGIFSSQVGSAFPNSFVFLVSVNILSLIIIGGMGNIPGVIVGALALVGLPELLREFSDYRFLFYGAALVLMMLTKPEGLLPEEVRKRELHEVEVEEAEGLGVHGTAAVAEPSPGQAGAAQ